MAHAWHDVPVVDIRVGCPFYVQDAEQSAFRPGQSLRSSSRLFRHVTEITILHPWTHRRGVTIWRRNIRATELI
jgi:hypothetical protein